MRMTCSLPLFPSALGRLSSSLLALFQPPLDWSSCFLSCQPLPGHLPYWAQSDLLLSKLIVPSLCFKIFWNPSLSIKQESKLLSQPCKSLRYLSPLPSQPHFVPLTSLYSMLSESQEHYGSFLGLLLLPTTQQIINKWMNGQRVVVSGDCLQERAKSEGRFKENLGI